MSCFVLTCANKGNLCASNSAILGLHFHIWEKRKRDNTNSNHNMVIDLAKLVSMCKFLSNVEDTS